MPVSATVGGDTLEFNINNFDEVSSSFQLVDTSGRGIAFSVHYPLQADPHFVGKNFQVYFLSKVDLIENEIFEFMDASQTPSRRIGWCVPINALDSTEHAFADNPHFLRYAYIGVLTALNSLDSGFYYNKVNLDSSSKTRITDIFHESTALLIISEETLLNGKFEIDRWLPALAVHGYFRLTTSDPGLMLFKRESIKEPKVTFEPISGDVGNVEYISNIYSKILPYEAHPLLQFFYLYQVIELLMEIIFRTEQAAFVQKIIATQGDVNATKELLERGRDSYSSEKNRINLLISKYSHVESSLIDLRNSCNRLLEQVGRVEGNSINSYLYPVRNFLFHQFRDFPNTADPLLENVVSSLLNCLPEIFAKFKVG